LQFPAAKCAEVRTPDLYFDIGGSFPVAHDDLRRLVPKCRSGGAGLHHQSILASADQREPAIFFLASSVCSLKATSNVTDSTSKRNAGLWDAIERYLRAGANQRTISNFGNIIGELKERLHRWTRGGQYGFLFDNAEDTLSFSRFQTFNFHGWNDAPEVWNQLLFYVLHRASNEITDLKRLATFKTFLLDEAWLFIRNETIRNYVVQAQKTCAKHNAAMILATQSIKELEESGMLAIVAESCPTKIFLANPEMNREVYRDAFHLNDTELDLIGVFSRRPDAHSEGTDFKEVQLTSIPSRLDGDQQCPRQPQETGLLRPLRFADGLRHLAEDIHSSRAR